MMKFLSFFFFGAFIWVFSFAILYGANALIGNAKPLDASLLLLMAGLGLFGSLVIGVAGAAGWLKRKK